MAVQGHIRLMKADLLHQSLDHIGPDIWGIGDDHVILSLDLFKKITVEPPDLYSQISAVSLCYCKSLF